eukprot:TRINITY_DN4303_c0_g1_i1.p2 TRINITY_DN4303_c0_g1~~TRINITY_DN4303_c0_g1_i1.p2  ORF type:complete len:56 (-),score=2.84 TRINITY_DN4303_c0_g1_i1:229-396(-)
MHFRSQQFSFFTITFPRFDDVASNYWIPKFFKPLEFFLDAIHPSVLFLAATTGLS